MSYFWTDAACQKQDSPLTCANAHNSASVLTQATQPPERLMGVKHVKLPKIHKFSADESESITNALNATKIEEQLIFTPEGHVRTKDMTFYNKLFFPDATVLAFSEYFTVQELCETYKNVYVKDKDTVFSFNLHWILQKKKVLHPSVPQKYLWFLLYNPFHRTQFSEDFKQELVSTANPKPLFSQIAQRPFVTSTQRALKNYCKSFVTETKDGVKRYLDPTCVFLNDKTTKEPGLSKDDGSTKVWSTYTDSIVHPDSIPNIRSAEIRKLGAEALDQRLGEIRELDACALPLRTFLKDQPLSDNNDWALTFNVLAGDTTRGISACDGRSLNLSFSYVDCSVEMSAASMQFENVEISQECQSSSETNSSSGSNATTSTNTTNTNKNFNICGSDEYPTAGTCVPLTTTSECGPGRRAVSTERTSERTQDNVCCKNDEFYNIVDAACQKYTVCPKGTEIQAADDNTDRECSGAACNWETEFADVDGQCQRGTVCTMGTVEARPLSMDKDRVCVPPEKLQEAQRAFGLPVTLPTTRANNKPNVAVAVVAVIVAGVVVVGGVFAFSRLKPKKKD